ncbi:BsaA family SipW-dependent biofilm matrix protein [Enterococcus sp. AZ072]|uniref:BsaA family SipW-dependent biofilm matrix protein n=1 Tax=unclassified Enterococcus TaxID=2608891 RepID=UPI003D28959C
MNQKEKRQHLFRVFLKSKGLFACFSIVLSLLLIVGSTYAWITSADERVNRTDANHRKLSAIVEEDFSQVFHWAPGTTKEKNVRVRNTGEVPTIVRISLKEFFVGFETDTADNHVSGDGNGNLKVYGLPSATTIDVKKTDTWVVGNTYGVNTDTYYKANIALLNQMYPYKGTRSEPLSKIEMNFEAGKVFDQNSPPAVNESSYWYFEKGYFYYSEVLQPNEVTPNLLDSVSLSAAYANQNKGALYKLVPEMQAHDLTKDLLSDWSISNGDYAYKMYQNKLDVPK